MITETLEIDTIPHVLTISGVSEPGTIGVAVQFGSETVNATVNDDGS